MLKTCFKCRQQMEAEENFYRHKEMGDGFLGKCKQCCKADVIQNRSAKIEYYRQYDRDRYETDPRRREALAIYIRTEHGKEILRRSQRRWKLNNPRKRAAHEAWRWHLLTHPEVQKGCIKCGEKAHAHHENYDYPLDVIWYCPKHHAERHKELRRQGVTL